MKHYLFLIQLFFVAATLAGQSTPHTYWLGVGVANFHNSYAENAPGMAIHLGYEYAFRRKESGLSFSAHGGYQYSAFTSTRSSGWGSRNGMTYSYHRSHEARLQTLNLGLGVGQQVRRFFAGVFMEGTYLIRATYGGFSGRIENEGPEVITDQFQVNLSQEGESELLRYRIRPDVHRFFANAGVRLTYSLTPEWELGVRYQHLLGYQEVGIESAEFCAGNDCEAFRQRGDDTGGNEFGTLLLTVGRKF